MPQGLSIGPDVAQEAMENLLRHLTKWVTTYFDDIAIFADTWNELLDVLKQVLDILEDAGFKINPNKCEWAKTDVPFLGHLLTPTGIRPQPNKVNAISKMQAPENLKQLRSFLGLVTYYRDM